MPQFGFEPPQDNLKGQVPFNTVLGVAPGVHAGVRAHHPSAFSRTPPSTDTERPRAAPAAGEPTGPSSAPAAAPPAAARSPHSWRSALAGASGSSYCRRTERMFTSVLEGQAPGFDTVWGDFRPPERLRAALLEYQKMHLAAVQDPAGAKLLVLKLYADAGLGNQILPFVSTVALGLLIRRVVVLQKFQHSLLVYRLFCPLQPPVPRSHAAHDGVRHASGGHCFVVLDVCVCVCVSSWQRMV